MGFLVKIFNIWILESGGRETLEGVREREREICWDVRVKNR